MRLKDKVAVVTGGASGNGAAMVHRFVAEGARVLLTDVSRDAGMEVAAVAGADFVWHDVTSEGSWASLAREVVGRHGRWDVLMNNAGIISDQAI